MSSKDAKDAEITQDIGKLLTKGSNEYKLFIRFLKYNATKGSQKMLAADHWTLLSQEQLDSVSPLKSKIIKPKQFQDEKGFLELTKEYKKYSDVGGVRRYHRFDDFSTSNLAKKAKISSEATDYLKVFQDKNLSSDNEESKNSCSKSAETVNEISSDSKNSIELSVPPFSRSKKVFDDEVYTIVGKLECSKISYIKGQVASIKEKLYTTEKQLEGVQNVLYIALKKIGLINPNTKSPFENEIAEL